MEKKTLGEHFREIKPVPPKVLLCCECEVRVSSSLCVQCDDVYCGDCFETDHSKGKKREHECLLLDCGKKSVRKLTAAGSDRNGRGVTVPELLSSKGWTTAFRIEQHRIDLEDEMQRWAAVKDEYREFLYEAFLKVSHMPRHCHTPPLR